MNACLKVQKQLSDAASDNLHSAGTLHYQRTGIGYEFSSNAWHQNKVGSRVMHNAATKSFAVVCLVLVGLVPLSLIRSVLSERRMRHQEATENITSTWGNSQTKAGPVLMIPYYRNVKVWKEQPGAGRTERIEANERVLARAYFPPGELSATGT